MRKDSRYMTAVARLDENSNLYLDERETYSYRQLPDNKAYTVKAGDSLRTIAAKEYNDLTNPPTFFAASLYWVIVDFQPEEIPQLQDPTQVLPIGLQLIIPSTKTVLERILPRLTKTRTARNG